MEDLDLGINTYGLLDDLVLYDTYLDKLKENNFTHIRVSLRNYDNIAGINVSKDHVAHILSKGMLPIWGITGHDLTAITWGDFEAAVKAAAAWAEANGVYEFQIGNEEEYHNDNTTLTDAQLITNLKTLATACQAIFTRGNISYCCMHSSINDWVTAGKGDIDILGSNIYIGGVTFNDNWKTEVDALYAGFGKDTAIYEFNLSYTSIDSYSINEDLQLNALINMIEYLKTSCIENCYFFSYNSDLYGALKSDGVTYRKIWDVLKITNDWKKRKSAAQKEIRGLSHG